MTDRVRYRSMMHDSARWDDVRLRSGDVVVSTPPKAGTTWTQTICLMLVHGRVDLPAPVAELSPWLDQQMRPLPEVLAVLDAQDGRRVVKTHTPLDGLPSLPGVHLVCVARDPRDMALSMVDHQGNLDLDRALELRERAVGNGDLADFGPATGPPADPARRLHDWVCGNPEYSVSSLQRAIHHWSTFWAVADDPAVSLVHYTDLCRDRTREVAILAGALGLAPDPERDATIAAATSFERMRGRPRDFAPNAGDGLWRDPGSFFRAGADRHGATAFDGSLRAAYDTVVADHAPPGLAAWMHGGRAALPGI